MNDAHDRFAPLTDGERSAHQMKECQKPDDGELVVPVPPDAPPLPSRHSRLGDPTAQWTYRNCMGEELCHIQRFDAPDGGKIFLPLTLRRTANGLRWLRKALPEPRPLYGLDLLAGRPEASVLVCEGEKSADAGQRIFPDYIATTSSGGAKADNQTDWTPLSRRRVIIWADNDTAGVEYAHAVANILKALDCEVFVIDVEQLVDIDGGNHNSDRNVEGWDAADAVNEWVDLTTLREAALRLVKPFQDDSQDHHALPVPTVPLYLKGDGGQESPKTESGRNAPEEGCAPRYNGTTGTISDGEERARHRELEIAVERERLGRSCKEIAESLRLLADVEEMVRRHGVVGESGAIRGTYLTASSRLNSASAICLLRRGAPAGGKNFLISNTLALIPTDCVVHMSSGSPLSLVYYGGGDEDALKHKIVYVPEAAIIAERNGVESPLTIMLRLLISEGRLDHNVALPQSDGLATVRIKRNGPVVVIITSARDDVEDELLTRLMTSDADESAQQTLAVLADALSNEGREVSEAEVERWLDFQRWLMIDAPYRVIIPFRQAILAAYNKRLKAVEARGEKPNIQLRLRRDVHAFLTAIKTSAILHKANRGTDSDGRIVATIDDYRHAHEAFDEGLARLYKIKTPDTALAVVRAVEAMGATPTFGVKVTVSALMAKLGITGRGAANDRLRDAEDRGFLRLVETPGGYGRTSPRIFEIAKTSEEIAGEIAAGAAPGVFPLPDEVENEVLGGGSTPRYSGTDGTVSPAIPTVPLYQGGGLRRNASESGASPSGESPPEPHENFAVSDFDDSTSIEEADDTNSAVGVNDWRDRLL
jgi:5S rRNA maturation endonuclease (ribonuclease M5)